MSFLNQTALPDWSQGRWVAEVMLENCKGNELFLNMQKKAMNKGMWGPCTISKSETDYFLLCPEKNILMLTPWDSNQISHIQNCWFKAEEYESLL